MQYFIGWLHSLFGHIAYNVSFPRITYILTVFQANRNFYINPVLSEDQKAMFMHKYIYLFVPTISFSAGK